MRDDLLTGINLAGKLRGSLVADNEGNVVAQHMLTAADNALLHALAAPIVGMLGTLETQATPPKAIDLYFAQGKVSIRNFDWGSIILLGSDKVNLPLLNLLLEVALPKIRRMMDTDEYRRKRKKSAQSVTACLAIEPSCQDESGGTTHTG